MKKEKKHNARSLVPSLRFPEFRVAGEWEKEKLGDIGEVVSGLTYSPDDVAENGVLVLRSSNIQDGVLSFEDNVFVKVNSYNAVKENDILICVRNGSRNLIGKNALINKESEGMAFGAFMSIYRSKYNLFLYQWFSSDFFFNQVKKNLGATINSINGNDLKKYSVSFPSLPEQQKIADCLSSLDELIQFQTKKLEALQSHKKGLLQNLFPAEGETVPKLRFPEFEGTGNWVEVGGDYLFDPITNKNHDSTLPILAITQEHGAIPRNLIDYNISVTEKSVESYKVVEPGDFIISLRSFQGGIEYSNYHGICSPAYIVLRKKRELCEHFYRYFFKTAEYIRGLNKNIEGIRDGKMVSYKQFSELLIPYPSLPEQQRIADCLTSVDALIQEQMDSLDMLKSHKKGLLQGLFPVMGE
ncbi:restriction endonuclease subunit S [Leptospira bandrabouensis]|uniref:restriction endonuclease subunit S n=1 Tax=Leptospira bandrabouensis TaxID=2484903 RepID=UPI00223DB8E1|nr:restriction endonuclease subunit S [Leptospira bandrabouensis]MCW7458565.1 restriction endonuclease subunit S [Leptospira bandrabouensis]MCW7478688.1 restriction endonuclease subunit S [Leptospira bandrabouensis]MCW7486648.1 restriction endonuclease subunit S [Leptospira bandrabouensis]